MERRYTKAKQSNIQGTERDGLGLFERKKGTKCTFDNLSRFWLSLVAFYIHNNLNGTWSNQNWPLNFQPIGNAQDLGQLIASDNVVCTFGAHIGCGSSLKHGSCSETFDSAKNDALVWFRSASARRSTCICFYLWSLRCACLASEGLCTQMNSVGRVL